MIARISWKFQLQSSLFKVLRRDCQKFLVCKFLWFSSQGLLSIYFQLSKGLLVYRFCKDRIIPTPSPSKRHTKKWDLVLCNDPILPYHGSLFSLLVQHAPFTFSAVQQCPRRLCAMLKSHDLTHLDHYTFDIDSIFCECQTMEACESNVWLTLLPWSWMFEH